MFFSTSKNVTIFLELGTNVTISSHRHIIFLGSAWNKTEFQNLARSWVLGSRFLRLGTTLMRTTGESIWDPGVFIIIIIIFPYWWLS